MYTIGIPDNREWEAALRDPIAIIGKAGIVTRRLAMPAGQVNPWNYFPDMVQDADFAWLVPLSFCRISPATDLVLAAVLNRQDPAYTLFIPDGDAILDAPMQIALAASVSNSDDLGASYLRDARPDLKLLSEPVAGSAYLANWLEGPKEELTAKYRLHVREFPPAAGAGVWAIVAHAQALELRRLLKHIHHPEVSRLTNVERALELRFVSSGVHSCGIHCEEDAEGYLHLWMAWKVEATGEVERAGVFSATTTGLEELAWAKTGLNFD